MLEPSQNLSALFRSLGPGDEKNSQLPTAVATPKTEQAWPLFGAVLPVKPEPTAPLTPQEKNIWQAHEAVKSEMPKPALSMPGLSSKLAKSLSEISGQVEQEMVKPAVQAASRTGPEVQIPDNARETLPETLTYVATPDLVQPSVLPERHEERAPGLGLFQNLQAEPMLAQGDAAATGKSSDFLANIFNRLEVKEKVVAKPAEKRSSLMNRLGKR